MKWKLYQKSEPVNAWHSSASKYQNVILDSNFSLERARYNEPYSFPFAAPKVTSTIHLRSKRFIVNRVKRQEMARQIQPKLIVRYTLFELT